MIGRIVATILMAVAMKSATAAPVKIDFLISNASVYDYVNKRYVDDRAINARGSIIFDTDPILINDYGSTTITYFGGFFSAIFDSPITPLIPRDPATGAYGEIGASYAFPNVSDYGSTFIEQAAFQRNAYSYNADEYKSYHIELRATRRTEARSGIGLSDYGFTRDGLIEFLNSFEKSSDNVHFNESYGVYRIIGGSPVYSEGFSWSAQAIIVGVTDLAPPVPEPSSLWLLLVGLFGSSLLILRSRPPLGHFWASDSNSAQAPKPLTAC